MYFRESENIAIEMSLNQGRLVQCLVVFVYGSENSWYGIARKNQLKI